MATLLRHYLIGLVIFTMLVTGGVTLMNMFQEEDSNFIPGDEIGYLNRSFNVYSDLDRQVGSIKTSVEDIDASDESFVGQIFTALDLFVMSLWTTVKVFATSIGFVTIFASLSHFLGIPTWVGASITTIVTIFILFTIISLLFKKDI